MADRIAPAAPAAWVVVTRPEREAAAWVQGLQAQGLSAVPLPLLAFGPPSDADSVARAWQALPQCDAVMFVSPQAVHAFWESRPRVDFKLNKPLSLGINGESALVFADWPEQSAHIAAAHRKGNATGPRCWAPGPGTARALGEWGVPPACIDQPPAGAAQFDSEALWPVVQPSLRPGMQVLVVRGESDAAADGQASGQGSGRDWLVRQCEAAGASVRFCAAYRRQSPQWGPGQLALAHQAVAAGAVWLLSSSESLGHLRRLLPTAAWGHATALATHPRIAQAARAFGFGHVWQSRPALADVAAQLHAGAGAGT
jgi:uroporphyrinogen-III synthase